MNKHFKILISLFLGLIVTSIFAKNALATTFDLIAPDGVLQRGQEVTFTVNIDTAGKTLTTTQIGTTYDSQYLEFINVTPGNTFPAVTVTPVETGKMLITGTSSSGFSGQGVFAYIKFKIIAQSPGSAQLCALWQPSPTPQSTLAPTQPPSYPTNTPQPTALPRSGIINKTKIAGSFGALFILFTAGAYFMAKKIFY